MCSKRPKDYFHSLFVVQSPYICPSDNVVADVLSRNPDMALAHLDSALSGFEGTLCRPFMNRVAYAFRFYKYEDDVLVMMIPV